jgi:hypothetical protein
LAVVTESTPETLAVATYLFLVQCSSWVLLWAAVAAEEAVGGVLEGAEAAVSYHEEENVHHDLLVEISDLLFHTFHRHEDQSLFRLPSLLDHQRTTYQLEDLVLGCLFLLAWGPDHPLAFPQAMVLLQHPNVLVDPPFLDLREILDLDRQRAK